MKSHLDIKCILSCDSCSLPQDGFRDVARFACLTCSTPEAREKLFSRLIHDQLKPIPLPLESLECKRAFRIDRKTLRYCRLTGEVDKILSKGCCIFISNRFAQTNSFKSPPYTTKLIHPYPSLCCSQSALLNSRIGITTKKHFKLTLTISWRNTMK